jgi:hypothetical protein
MPGRTMKIGAVKVGSAVVALAASMWFAGTAEAARGDTHRPGHRHGGGPRVEYVTVGNSPRFLASRSTHVLATRNMRVLAAPHQLAPTTTVTFLPGAGLRPRHCGAAQCGRQNCGDLLDVAIHDDHHNLQPQDVNPAPEAASQSATNSYSAKRSPVFRVIHTGRP